MGSNLSVNVGPHIYSKRDTSKVMLDVVIALLPAAVASVVIFGSRALLVIVVSVAASVIFEQLFDTAVHRKSTVKDFSAVITGLLLALNMPATIPVWQLLIGDLVAVVLVKCLFGGLGSNIANPAITARVFMLFCFTDSMSAVVMPKMADAVSEATPLAVLAGGEDLGISIGKMFLGVHGGALGETSALALLIGGAYLLARGVISWHTPVSFIGVVFVGSLIVTGSLETAVLYCLSGGLLIGAIFMATDYVTTPVTKSGKLAFGIGCGLITLLVRFAGSYPEGVSISILFMNFLTPYLDKWTRRIPFGGIKA